MGHWEYQVRRKNLTSDQTASCVILIRERVIQKAAGGAYIFTVVFWLVQILTVVVYKYPVYEAMALGQYGVEN